MTTYLAPDRPTQIAAGRPPLYPGRPQGDHKRSLLIALVDADPGIHVLRAAHLLGINWNTCLHHARRLASEGRVVIRKVKGRLCLFDRQEGAVATRIAPLLLRDPRTADLAKFILDHPGINQKAMAGALGIPPSAVHRHVLRLEEAGLILRVHHSREMSAYPSDRLAAAWSAKAPGSSGSLVPSLAIVGDEPVATAPLAALFTSGEPIPDEWQMLPV